MELGLQPQIPENYRSFLKHGLFGVNKFGKIPPKHRPPHSGSYSSNYGISGTHSHSDGYGSHGYNSYGSHSHNNLYGSNGNGHVHGPSHGNAYQSYGSSHKHGHGHHGNSYGSGYGSSHGSDHLSKPPKQVYSQIYELSHGIPNYNKKSHGMHGSNHHRSHKGLYNSHSKFRSNDEMKEPMMPSSFEFDHSEFQDMNQV